MPGYVTDFIASNSEGDISVSLQGDAVADLSAMTAILVDAVSYSLTQSPAYDGGFNLTNFRFESATTLDENNTFTIQLV